MNQREFVGAESPLVPLGRQERRHIVNEFNRNFLDVEQYRARDSMRPLDELAVSVKPQRKFVQVAVGLHALV